MKDDQIPFEEGYTTIPIALLKKICKSPIFEDVDRILTYILVATNGGTQKSFISMESFIENTNLTKLSIENSLEKLIFSGLISSENNEYSIKTKADRNKTFER